MKKQIWKQVISLTLSLALIMGMLQGFTLKADAAEAGAYFYLYCQTCEKNIGARAKINGTEYNTGSYVTVSTSVPNKVEIISADGNHVLETINWNYSENNGTFSVPIYHKTDVTVRVKDSAGNAVPNRTVTTNWNNISGKTDKNGEFKLSTRSIWYLEVTVEDPNGNITKTQRASDNNGVIEITIPNRRAVDIYLKSSAKQMLKGDASVYEASGVALTETSDGVYRGVFIPGQTYTITVSNIPGHDSASKTFTVSDSVNSVDIEVGLLEPKVLEGDFISSKEVNSLNLKVGEKKDNLSISMFDDVNGYTFIQMEVKGPGGSYSWETTDSSIFDIGDNGSYKYITGKAPGTANLKVTVTSGGVSKTKIIPVTVSKADPFATVTAPTAVVYSDYEGNFTFRSNVAGTFRIFGNDVKVNANTDVTKTVKEIVTINRPVGSFTLQWEFTPDDAENYNTKADAVIYTVVEKDITKTGTVTFADEDFIYDGTAHEVANLTVKVGSRTLEEGIDYTVSYENNVNAGQAAVTVTGKGNYGGSIKKAFTIQKAALSVENVTAESRQYDGTNVVKITGVGLKNLASKDAAVNVIDWAGASAAIDNKNIGTYDQVTHVTGIRLKDTKNYTLNQPAADAEVAVTGEGVTISPKKVNIENVVIQDSKIYDGNVSAVILEKGTLSANYDGEDLYIVEGTASYTDKTAGADKSVTFAGFKLDGLAAFNYELTEQPAAQKADIEKKPLYVAEGTADVKDKYYDGTNAAEFAAEPELVLEDLVDGDDVSLDFSAIPTFDEIGSPDEEKVITVTPNLSLIGEDASNYDLKWAEVIAVILNYTAEKEVDYQVNSNDWQNQDFEVQVKDGYYIAGSLNESWQQKLTVSCDDNDSKTGAITFYVKYPDGKISKIVEEEYRIDKIAPAGTVTFTEAENTWNTFVESPVFELYYNNAQEVVITAEDQEGLSGVASVEWQESSEGNLSLEEVKSLTDWNDYEGNLIVPLADAKKFVYYVKITDAAGNVTYLSTDGAVYDTTLPAIKGVTDGETYYTAQQVQVSDTNLKEVTFNGTQIPVNEGIVDPILLAGNVEATYTVTAVDKAGNESKITVIMKPAASLNDAVEKLPDAIWPDELDVIEELQKLKEDYDSLTEEEKALISEENKAKLEELLAQAVDYKIVEGNGASIREDAKDSLRFKANGAYAKFIGVKVDGSLLDTEDYTAEEGSTIITLKKEFLDTLSVGKHTITVLYTDGETTGEFTITAKPAAAPGTPDTGDQGAFMGYLIVMLISAMLIVFVVVDKRRNMRR